MFLPALHVMGNWWEKRFKRMSLLRKGAITQRRIKKLTIPTKIGTSTSSIATAYSMQRKIFFSNGLFRTFFWNGTTVCYYKGTIKLLKFTGTEWLAEKEAFPRHTYDNPTYLSSNRNVQQGKICLTWTEKTTSPYEVWACSLEE